MASPYGDTPVNPYGDKPVVAKSPYGDSPAVTAQVSDASTSKLTAAKELGQGAANTAVDLAAGLYGGYHNLVKSAGEYLGLRPIDTPTEKAPKDLKELLDRQDKVISNIVNKARPFKNEGAKQAEGFLGEELDKFVRFGGRVAHTAVDAIPFVGPELANKYWPAIETGGEVGIQMLPIERGIRGAGAAMEALKAAREIPKGEPLTPAMEAAQNALKETQMPTEQQSLPLEQQGPQGQAFTPEEIAAQRAQAAQGELQTTAEQQAFLNQQLSGQKDMFTQPDFGTGPDYPTEGGPTPRTMPEPADVTGPGGYRPRPVEQNIQPHAYGGMELAPVSPDANAARAELSKRNTFETENQPMSEPQVQQGRFYEDTGQTVTPQEGSFQGHGPQMEPHVNMPEEMPMAKGSGDAAVKLSPDYYSFNHRLEEALRTGNGRIALQTIRNTSENPAFRELADTLLNNPEFKFGADLASHDVMNDLLSDKTRAEMKGQTPHGLFKGTLNTAFVRNDLGAVENIFLHEAVHAKAVRLQHLFDVGALDPKAHPEAYQAAANLVELWKLAKDELTAKGEGWHYGLKNPMEFLSEALTNKQFKEALNFTVGSRGKALLQVMESIWHAVVREVGKMLGFTGRAEDNLLAHVLQEGMNLIEATNKNQATGALAGSNIETAKLYSTMQGAWLAADLTDAPMVMKPPPIKQPTKKAFLASLAAEHDPRFLKLHGDKLYKVHLEQWRKDNVTVVKPAGFDNRDFHTEFKPDLYRKEDGKQKIADVRWAPGPAGPMAETHPILRRVYDQITQASANVNNIFDNLWRKAEVYTGKGVSALRHAKLRAHPDSLDSLFQTLKPSSRKRVLDLLSNHEHSNLRNLGYVAKNSGSDVQVVRFFKALDDFRKQALETANEVMRAAGRPEIKDNPDWVIPFTRPGEYHVYVPSDKTGGPAAYRASFRDKATADNFARKLRDEGEITAMVVDSKTDPRRTTLPPEAFIGAARVLEGKEAELALQAAEAVKKRWGMSKHTMPRDSVASGQAASATLVRILGPDKAWAHLQDTMMTYARSVANSKGNYEFGKRINQMIFDTDLKRDYPNATEIAADRYNEYRGANKYNNNALRALVKAANRGFISVVVTMMNPKFYFANAVQWGFSYPKMMEAITKELGGKGSATVATIKALNNVFLMQNAAKVKAIIQQAVRNGSLEPKYAEALDWQMKARTPFNFTGGFGSQKMSILSDSFGRMMSYNMFYELGKDAGLSEKLSHEFAARQSQNIMIQYDRWARMPVLNHMGVAGDLISPLTTFTSNVMWHIARYAHDATIGDLQAGRFVRPLMAALAFQIAISGVRGLPGYDDLEQAFLNLQMYLIKRFGMKYVGSPSEWMNKVGTPEWLQYGVPSAATDMYLTGTLGLGSIVPGFAKSTDPSKMFPGVQMGTNAIDATWTATQKMFGTADNRELKKSVQDISPPMIRELIRGYVGDNGAIKDAKGQTLYQRSPEERLKSVLTGSTSIKEHEIKRELYTNKSVDKAINDLKQRVKDLIISGNGNSPVVTTAMKNYPEILQELDFGQLAKLAEQRNIPLKELTQMKVIQGKQNLKSMRQMQQLHQIFNYGNQ